MASHQSVAEFAAEFGDGTGTMVHCVHNEPLTVVSAPVNSVQIFGTRNVVFGHSGFFTVMDVAGRTSADASGMTFPLSECLIRKQYKAR